MYVLKKLCFINAYNRLLIYIIKSISCDNRSNLVETIDQFVNYKDGPILCEFKIERDICLPLVGPGCSLDDMILPKEQMGSNNINLTKGLAPS